MRTFPELGFRIHKQRIERVILTGPMEQLDAALEHIAKTGYVMSKVGPQTIRAAGASARNDNSFLILAEKVIR